MKVMIIGGGKVGAYLANYLIQAGHQVKLLENRREEVEELSLTRLPKDTVLLGSGTDPDFLESSGIRQMQVVAAVTGDDEINLVVTNLARFEFNVPRTIARINHPENAWMFRPDMGVDVALNQADLMGKMIAEEMSMGDMMFLIKLRKGLFSIVEEKVAPDSYAAGKKIRDLQLPDQCVLTAVLRKGELMIPHGDLELQPADEVLAIVHESQCGVLADRLENQP
jgi:trk system potassium uptake protein TrkA